MKTIHKNSGNKDLQFKNLRAVILAGGEGTRLKPFTANFPKPLVPVDDMPILEIILRQLKHHGFSDITIAVNHLADLIMAFFKDGKKYGLNIDYSLESKPLGTAGPISLIKDLPESFLVMNGDILTTIDYGDLYKFHVLNKCDITIASFKREEKIDLGVLEIGNSDEFINYIEKPSYFFDVSMGVYIIDKSIQELIPHDTKFDLPELVLKAHVHHKKIKCYKGNYSWLDIGRVDDYGKANELFKNNRDLFLP
jgi:NDP-sugar pyrophosphorylase family protein